MATNNACDLLFVFLLKFKTWLLVDVNNGRRMMFKQANLGADLRLRIGGGVNI